jgi:hypothetical protein
MTARTCEHCHREMGHGERRYRCHDCKQLVCSRCCDYTLPGRFGRRWGWAECFTCERGRLLARGTNGMPVPDAEPRRVHPVFKDVVYAGRCEKCGLRQDDETPYTCYCGTENR